ncbi:hypothetical protein H1164_15050 [Thermoactinomyces daqus]|uniref:Uncharacterized protein n=1 Tax=Thermoactinomyces daqus TaxID=1329516 RepID=A0A7W1XCR9_9BACL|nr:hypothetical protein [Thermoactinomyces daqus]MBA4544179.1 hypothetical protein [Thermoactinomyces daqus]
MSYHKGNRKRDRFDYAITGIFIFAIIVSFNHTIELYKSAGFDDPIGWLNHLTEKWLGENFFTLALFATLAAEAAFSVGLWGLYEAFRVEQRFPGWRYKWMWGMFLGGLVVIGWANIGGTLGYNYLYGNPIKGLVLGLSVPYFVLNAVLVNFSRSMEPSVQPEQPEQSKLTLWAASLGNALNTFMEITQKPERAVQEHTEQNVHVQGVHSGLNHFVQDKNEHSENVQAEQGVHSQDIQSEQSESVQAKQDERSKDEQIVQEKKEQAVQNERPETEQPEHVQRKRTNLYIVNGSKNSSKVEQAVQCAIEMLERNEQISVRKLAQAAGCSLGTAQNALNKLKERKQA